MMTTREIGYLSFVDTLYILLYKNYAESCLIFERECDKIELLESPNSQVAEREKESLDDFKPDFIHVFAEINNSSSGRSFMISIYEIKESHKNS